MNEETPSMGCSGLLIPLALSALLCILTTGCGREPENYNDCILKYVKADMDNGAVSAIMDSCRAKFPATSTAPRTMAIPLSRQQLRTLTGRAGLSGNYYSGSIYNGNIFTVTEIEITLTTTIGGEAVSRVYRHQATISPQSIADFAFPIIVGDKDASYSWSISGATGIFNCDDKDPYCFNQLLESID